MVDIYWYGQSCFRIKGKNAAVVVDPYKPDFVGLKLPRIEADIVCVSHGHEDHNFVDAVKSTEVKDPVDVSVLGGKPFVIEGPGEYEISGVNIVGIASFHDDKNGEERGKNTIYQIIIDGVSIVHLGDLGQKKLTQTQIEAISGCDVLMIPVGGVYTIEAKDAPDIIASLEAKIVVPMHYKISGLKFELAPVSDFMKVMGKENIEAVPKLSVSADKLPEELEVALLTIV